MSSKSTRSNPGAESSTDSQSPLNVLAESARQQLTYVAQAAQVLQRSSETLHKLQQKMTEQTTLRIQDACQSISGSLNPAELLETQAKQWRQELEDSAANWRELSAAILQMNSDILSFATESFKQQLDGPLKPTFDSLQALSFKPPFFNQESAASKTAAGQAVAA
jgi:hypothetical protein